MDLELCPRHWRGQHVIKMQDANCFFFMEDFRVLRHFFLIPWISFHSSRVGDAKDDEVSEAPAVILERRPFESSQLQCDTLGTRPKERKEQLPILVGHISVCVKTGLKEEQIRNRTDSKRKCNELVKDQKLWMAHRFFQVLYKLKNMECF